MNLMSREVVAMSRQPYRTDSPLDEAFKGGRCTEIEDSSYLSREATMASTGYIVMADITGYTMFLNHSELEHAKESLAAILEVIVDGTTAPLVVSRLVGDAVVSYAYDGQLHNSQTLVEEIEDIYVVYRRALEQMVLNTTCTCNACANLSSLDLKFIVHHGEFSIQEMAGHEELIGPEVNVVFRLAKNSVREQLDVAAYILYTEAATSALDLEEFTAHLTTMTESVDDFGDMTIYVADMHPVWDKRKNESLVDISGDDVWLTFERDIDAPVGVVWDHLTDPAHRARIFGSVPGGEDKGDDGRMSEGGAYVCAHGKYLVPHRIVEWIPLKQYTFDSHGPIFKNLWQMQITDLGGATRLDITVGRSRASWGKRKLLGLGWKRYTIKATEEGLDEFVSAVEAETGQASS